MAFGKKKTAEFLKVIEEGRKVMPREIIKPREYSLFDDVDDLGKPLYQHVRLELVYPEMNENLEGNPMAKQSFRQFVQREKSGDVFVFNNQRTGKKDVIMKGYTDAKITKTAEIITLQSRVQIAKNHIGFRQFTKDVHITRCEFIFAPIASMTKADKEALNTGEFIVWKDTKPDLDNLLKLIWDALEAAGVMENDARICSYNGIFKRYGPVPGVIIELEGRI
jgi:Holliday junction resolvase RusA-like endonuclease